MNKIKTFLATLEGKTLAEQAKMCKDFLADLFKDTEAQAGITRDELQALVAKTNDIESKATAENKRLTDEATAATKRAEKAEADHAKLASTVQTDPAFAHAAAAGKTHADISHEPASVIGSLADRFRTICASRRVNGNVVPNVISADAVRFFLKNEDALRQAAHDRSPLLSGFDTPAIKAAFSSGGTPTTGTGLALTVTAIQTIRQYGAFLTPLRAISTDFSPEAIVGTTLLTRVVPLSGDAGDLNDDYSGDYLAAAATTTTTPITIDMTGHPISAFSVTPDQVSNMAQGVWPKVMEANQALKVYAIAKYCLKETFAVLTQANYGVPVLTINPANMNASVVSNLSGVLKEAGFQPGMMSLVLNSRNWSALGGDSAIANNFAVANQVATSGTYEKQVYGFNMVEAPTMPFSGSTPATEKLTGFAAMKGGLCVGMRPGPQPPIAIPGLVFAQTIEDEQTGAVITLSMQLDQNTRSLVVTLDNRFGVAKGDANQLKLIASP